VSAYRRIFEIAGDAVARIHVSADERYELFLDGRRIGRGPERGAPECWFYETHDLPLPSGQHTLVARVWSQGALAPLAQLSLRPGFLLAAEGAHHELLSTGVAPWESKVLEGYSFVSPGLALGTGAKVMIDGEQFPWGFERGEGEGWQPVVAMEAATEGEAAFGWRPQHRMAPAMLPPMMEAPRRVGRVRHVSAPSSFETAQIAMRESENLTAKSAHWDILQSEGAATVPARTLRRVLWDLENYYCAYPEIVLSGGKGARVRMTWVECLYEELIAGGGASWWERMPKGHRDEIEGKYVLGVGDTFLCDGGPARRFDTLWWRPGRYVELVVETADEALTIERVDLFETRYPLEMASHFSCEDPRMEQVTPLVLRGLQMSSHETPIDCPGHEQHLFSPDTRLAALTEYAMAGDDRLARKAMRLHDLSRQVSGMTRCC
jgi:hypothetical protein